MLGTAGFLLGQLEKLCEFEPVQCNKFLLKQRATPDLFCTKQYKQPCQILQIVGLSCWGHHTKEDSAAGRGTHFGTQLQGADADSDAEGYTDFRQLGPLKLI